MNARYHVALVAQTLLIGPGYVLASWASADFDPAVLLLLRGALAAPFFLVLFFWRGGFRRFRPSRAQVFQLSIAALLVAVLNQFFFTYGLKYTTPATSALMYATTPLLVLFISAGVFRLEAFTLSKLLGIGVALCGVLFVLAGQGGLGGGQALGALLTLVAVLGWALYLVVAARSMQTFDPFQATAFVMVLGLVLFAPVGLFHLEPGTLAAVSPRGWVGMASLVLVNSLLCFLLMNYALGGLPSTQVAVYMNAQPAAAVLAGVVLGTESLTLGFVAGGGLTLLGIAWVQHAKRRSYVQDRAVRIATLRRRGQRALKPTGRHWLANRGPRRRY